MLVNTYNQLNTWNVLFIDGLDQDCGTVSATAVLR